MSFEGVTSSFRIPARFEGVSLVRSATAALLARHDWPSEVGARIVLAVSEAVTNAVEHGSPAGGEVQVDLEFAQDRALVIIRDRGRDGATVVVPTGPPPDNDQRGRGLIIMQSLSDSFTLADARPGTEVRLGFDRRPAAAAVRAVA